MQLTEQEALQVIERTPLVSIDLIVQDRAGRILLGERVNEPARGYWFVPGGRIDKDEKIAEAFQRILLNELGISKKIDDAAFKGVFEHIYSENFLEIPEIGTHYVVLAYMVPFSDDQQIQGDDQHSALKWFTVEELLQSAQVHPYTKQYFGNVGEKI